MNLEGAMRLIIRQNDLILAYLKIDLDVDDQQLRRTALMAKSVQDLAAALAAETDIVKAMRIQITHNNEVMDEIADRLKNAGTDQAALDALHANIVANSAEMSAAKDELVAAALRDTPFNPSGN